MHALLMVLDTKNSSDMSVFDIFAIAGDETETHCGTFDTATSSGFEAKCNMRVQSFRIEGTPSISPSFWNVHICSLGAFGSIYEHPNSVPISFDVIRGQQASLTIAHVEPRSGFEVTNVQIMSYRQKIGTELP